MRVHWTLKTGARAAFGFALLTAGLLAITPVIFAQNDICNQPSETLATASGCGLKGPVHSEETWYTIPDEQDQDPVVQYAAALHTFQIFARDGTITQIRQERNGSLEEYSDYAAVHSGDRIVVTADSVSLDLSGSSTQHSKQVYGPRGNLLHSESQSDDGSWKPLMDRAFDDQGREISETYYTAAGKIFSNALYTYDDEGRLIGQVDVDAKGKETWWTEYQYPGPGEKNALIFDFSYPRDPKAPASSPTFIIETKYDSAGRVLEEVTTEPVKLVMPPGIGWGCSHCRRPERVVWHYDSEGRMLDVTHYSLAGDEIHREVHSYDQAGNRISEAESGADLPSPYEDHFEYRYDREGNWTERIGYTLKADGTRQVFRIDHRALEYYPQ